MNKTNRQQELEKMFEGKAEINVPSKLMAGIVQSVEAAKGLRMNPETGTYEKDKK